MDGGAAFQGPSHGCGPPIGNCAGNGLTGMGVPVDALFSSYIEARLIRIYPLTNVRGWYMRAAVLVVDYPPPPPSPPSPPAAPPSIPPSPAAPPLPVAPLDAAPRDGAAKRAPDGLRSLAPAAADTFGSELGPLGKGPVWQLPTLNKVKHGTPGGVSMMGLLGAGVGAAGIAGAGYSLLQIAFLPVMLAGILASLIDGFLSASTSGRSTVTHHAINFTACVLGAVPNTLSGVRCSGSRS